MNERIKELIDKATVPVIETNDYNGMAYETYQFSQELFAELIVKETCNIILHYHDVDEGVSVAKMHFGVE